MSKKKNRLPAIATGVSVGVGVAAAACGALVAARKSASQRRALQGDVPRIVILGAGFAGLTAAWKLSDRLKGRASITLVDRNNFHLFTPMLYQVATLGVGPYTVAFPIRQFSGPHGAVFRLGEITGIDFDARKVQLKDGTLDYDYLVIALGSTTNFFGNKSAEEHTLALKSLEEGVAVRNHLLDMLEEAAITEDKARRKALLTFVIVGGGATGVETAAALETMLRSALPSDYPGLDPAEAKVILIESEGQLLGHMGAGMADIALNTLRKEGVEVWLNTKAKEVGQHRVATDNGRTVDAQTVIWAAGVRVPEVVSSLQVEHGKGGSVAVDEYLQVCGKQNVYAVGDCAHFEDPKSGESAPLLASSAVQEGETVSRNIELALEGKAQEPFHYKDLGSMVALGHFTGAAQVKGIAVGGVIGWLAWRMVHLAKITSFRSKLATLLDWSMGYFYTPDSVRITGSQ